MDGTLATIPTITRDDLVAFAKRTMARANLKVAVVGDISPEDLGRELDRVFGTPPGQGGPRSGGGRDAEGHRTRWT